jgi:hypothetical protein
MRLQQIPAAARTETYVTGEDSVCLLPMAPALPRVPRERAPGPGSASWSPCDGMTLISDVAFTIKQYVQTRVEADRQVAIILVS